MVQLFLDSGAFSLKPKAKAYHKKHNKGPWSYYDSREFWEYVDSYANFVKKYQKVITYYANIDVIHNPELSWRNLKYLEEKHELKPVPVLHTGAGVKWLHKHMDAGYDFIGLGGIAGGVIAYRWLDAYFSAACPGPTKLPKIRLHGFGLTSFKAMLRYPWFCMTDEHEVLTQQGWKGGNEIKIGDMVLAYDKGESRWEPVLEVPKFPVLREPIVEMDYRNFSARVTHNHRWLVKHRVPYGRSEDNNLWSWKTTEELKGHHYIPRSGKYQGPKKEQYPDYLVELFAWYWTEGSIKKRSKYKKDSVSIYQSESKNPEKVKLIRKALLEAGEQFCEGVDARPTKTGKESRIVGFELYGWVRDWLLETSPDKIIPMEFLLRLTCRQLRRFVKISVMADGSWRRPLSLVRKLHTPWVKSVRKQDQSTDIGFALSQGTRLQNIDMFRIACILAGYPTSKYTSGSGCFATVQSSDVQWVYPSVCQTRESLFTGELWCIRVKSGAFFTKCNEKVYVTGNSVDSATWTKLGAYGSILVPKKRNGAFVYPKMDGQKVVQKPDIVTMSKDGAHTMGRHYKTLSPAEQIIVGEWLEQIEVPLGKTKPNGDVVEYGVSNRHSERKIANLVFFEGMRKALPEYPWPFAPHGLIRHRGFGL